MTSRQAEIRNHGANGSVGSGSQNDIVALQVAVDHAAAMRFRQASAKLLGNDLCLLPRYCAAVKPLAQRLTLQKLHREKIDLPMVCGDGMNLKYSADAWVCDFTGVTHFRRQPPAETRLGALDGNAPAQFFIHGFVNDAHASVSYFAHDAEPVV